MKKYVFLISVFVGIISGSVNGQISLKNVLERTKEKTDRKVENRIENKLDNAVDKTLDDVEDSATRKSGKGNKKKSKSDSPGVSKSTGHVASDESPRDVSSAGPAPMNVQWNKFDFVPGDKVIFEDGPDPMEENGEFPSRWDLVEGQVEIATVNGETVMMFLDGGKIIPYLKNRDQDYLPDVFTIEFDFYTPKDGNRIKFFLSDQKNQTKLGGNAQEFDVTPIRIDTPDGNHVEHSQRDYSYCENGCWTHVSIAFTNGRLKIYLDDTRLVNIPHYEFNPTGFTFYPYFAEAADNKVFYAKNFRIAEGGVKYYDRVMTDGKIICNGIRFDVNKATLKAESMGPINNIFELMQKQPDLKFSVEGHTDSDGDETINQKLSEERAKTVKEQLITMGIAAERLSSKGFGESKPVDNNSTAEGKAQNRRVEFVKF